MGFIRTFGLLFFMTILIGGCIVAVSTSPSPDPVPRNSISVTWPEAQQMMMDGKVASITRTQSLELVLQMRDGKRLVTRAPDLDELQEGLIRCGEICRMIVRLNV